jgi:hypothetical protein
MGAYEHVPGTQDGATGGQREDEFKLLNADYRRRAAMTKGQVVLVPKLAVRLETELS